MKKIRILFPAILAMATLLFTTGCAGVSKTGKLAGYMGTSTALTQHPEWRPHFVQAEKDLAVLEAQETIDIVTLLAVMNRLPIKELKSPEARIVITTVTITIEEFNGESVALDQVKTEELRKFIHRLREGINLALLQSAPPDAVNRAPGA